MEKKKPSKINIHFYTLSKKPIPAEDRLWQGKTDRVRNRQSDRKRGKEREEETKGALGIEAERESER